jgi:catecholate siderophore receptor
MFATIDNTVTLPGYFRADAALYITLSEKMRLQGNLENISNKKYFMNATATPISRPVRPARSVLD